MKEKVDKRNSPKLLTLSRRERVVSRIQGQKWHPDVVHLLMSAGVPVIVLIGLVSEQLGREILIKVSYGYALQSIYQMTLLSI